jgi:hypothetical protein
VLRLLEIGLGYLCGLLDVGEKHGVSRSLKAQAQPWKFLRGVASPFSHIRLATAQ